ncbi:hypothetical protein MSG28_008117 [Choristoneura fumiferana]|uniref:Uncharacterized protein n=1 Tax=Choristoneura fumiferana TaxID=7141 RepID=A0ACC0JA12_CHOFU|nr:hypothetical protein MSG28_008117 [Choristoneura fumiferana]
MSTKAFLSSKADKEAAVLKNTGKEGRRRIRHIASIMSDKQLSSFGDTLKKERLIANCALGQRQQTPPCSVLVSHSSSARSSISMCNDSFTDLGFHDKNKRCEDAVASGL